MIKFDIDGSVVLEQQHLLEKALSTNPKTKEALRKLIRRVIMQARAHTVGNIKFENGDPRQSAHAVRTSVYKKILGGNINIYNSKKAHGFNNYEPPRTLRPGQRGGNRMTRSFETNRRMHYGALDRGFILRFVNSGTKVRYAGSGRNGRNEYQYNKFINDHNGVSNRGSIAARNFFRGAAEPTLVRAADELANLIDTELENILNTKK